MHKLITEVKWKDNRLSELKFLFPVNTFPGHNEVTFSLFIILIHLIIIHIIEVNIGVFPLV